MLVLRSVTKSELSMLEDRCLLLSDIYHTNVHNVEWL